MNDTLVAAPVIHAHKQEVRQPGDSTCYPFTQKNRRGAKHDTLMAAPVIHAHKWEGYKVSMTLWWQHLLSMHRQRLGA